MNLLTMDWDEIEKLITELLTPRVRAYEYYDYFIIDDNKVLIKVYGEGKQLMFTVKAVLSGDKLAPLEVS